MTSHDEDSSNQLEAVSKNGNNQSDHLSDLKEEMTEIHSTLKEERLTAQELKVQLEKLTEAVEEQRNGGDIHLDDGDDDEKLMYKEQVTALTQGKLLRK